MHPVPCRLQILMEICTYVYRKILLIWSLSTNEVLFNEYTPHDDRWSRADSYNSADDNLTISPLSLYSNFDLE